MGAARGSGVQALRAVLGEELEPRPVGRPQAPRGPAGHAQDPTVVVPALVAEVASAHGLSEDAAALYLQLLALPDPTDRNCARWTGWRPARMKKARAELAATELVVEAKRSARRPHPLPAVRLARPQVARPAGGDVEGRPLPGARRLRAVPRLPVPDLFAHAWQRVQDGDAPAYEKLTTRATRKARRR